MSEILIQYHPNSLEGFYNGGNSLRMIGAGRRLSPGHPAGNQQYHSQLPFLRQASKQWLFPAYYCCGPVKIHMGDYAVHSFKKKESFEGFTYFVFTLHRKRLPLETGKSGKSNETEVASPVETNPL
jgi:hypothetical protein